MTENQRETFRIDADPELRAELVHEGRAAQCALLNLSAGGAKLTSELRMPQGTPCTLRVRLEGELREATGTSPVSLQMEVLECSDPSIDGPIAYRLRSTMTPGAPDYEAAAKLVTATQRRAIARSTGAAQSSPMVSDEERRRGLRPDRSARFSKGSLRPDQD